MRVIVFGGTGWVGHHIARAFHSAGYEVSICSRGKKTTYEQELPTDVERIQTNKSDEADMARVFQKTFDVVVDSVPTEASIEHIAKHARGLKRYLHCSSTGGYAPLPLVPGDETMPYDQFMGGWKLKSIVDGKVLDLFRQTGFPATVLRPSYITGPGLLALDNLGGRREDFIADILNGKTLDVPNDGQALLQPVHVEDLARAFVLAAEQLRSVGEVYNICLEKAVTLLRYLEITATALDRTVKLNFMSVEAMLAKYGEAVDKRGLHFLATHMCFDIRKAREQLGYNPHCSTEEAIRETARWAASTVR